MIKNLKIEWETIQIAADFCEELGEQKYSEIIRDFAHWRTSELESIKSRMNSIDTLDPNLYFPDTESESMDPFDRFIVSMEPLQIEKKNPDSDDRTHSTNYSVEDLKAFLKQQTVDELLEQRGFEKALPAIRRLRMRLESILESFVLELLTKNEVSIHQVIEATRHGKQIKRPIAHTLVSLGYATEEEVAIAQANFYDLEYVAMSEIEIEHSITELVPEAVCRENAIIPIREEDDTLILASSTPFDPDTESKLKFILNRNVRIALGTPSAIQLEINRMNLAVEGESYDGPLLNFTDTAIHFTDTEPDAEQDQSGAPPEEPRQLLEPETDKLLRQFRTIWTPVDE